ncbi:hypothetical protein D3C85_1706220 [compost metagenome]
MLPEQIVLSSAIVPPTEGWSTVIVTTEESSAGQVPFLTTALNFVVAVNAPEVYEVKPSVLSISTH